MIRLSPNGVFPIVYDENGVKLEVESTTGFNRPGTIQGEGKWAGTSSLFIRLWGCNLDCKWKFDDSELSFCDTQEAISEKENSVLMPVDTIVQIIKNNRNNCKHVVVTGGEPLLQKKGLIDLLKRLKELDLLVTLETNATIFSSDVLEYVDLLSMSPKLQNSFNGDLLKFELNKKRNREVIERSVQFYKEKGQGEFQIKFVVAHEVEIQEICSLIDGIGGIDGDDILLMPLGATWEEQQRSMTQTIEFCIREGWRFAPRLHVMQWGDKRGV